MGSEPPLGVQGQCPAQVPGGKEEEGSKSAQAQGQAEGLQPTPPLAHTQHRHERHDGGPPQQVGPQAGAVGQKGVHQDLTSTPPKSVSPVRMRRGRPAWASPLW